VPCRKKKKKRVHYNFTTFTVTLLNGGKTAHLALKLPLNIQTNENAVCNIKKHLGMAKVLQNCHIIL